MMGHSCLLLRCINTIRLVFKFLEDHDACEKFQKTSTISIFLSSANLPLALAGCPSSAACHFWKKQSVPYLSSCILPSQQCGSGHFSPSLGSFHAIAISVSFFTVRQVIILLAASSSSRNKWRPSRSQSHRNKGKTAKPASH
jgi:hypothetical protein